jgi:hypothetical protein
MKERTHTMPKCTRYHLTTSGFAEGISIAICSPNGSLIASVMGLAVFGDVGGIDQAKADAQLIVDALNAYTLGDRP